MESRPVCIRDFEQIFWKALDRKSWLYIQSGTHNEDTLKDNVDAYSRYKLQPRVLRDVSNIDTTTTVLGQRISMPICIAPSSMHKNVHPDGEAATAKAAASKACLYAMSSAATSSIEEVHEAAPTSLKWFQVYMYRRKDLCLNLIKRAQRCGFKAVVLTVDTAVFASPITPHLKRQPFKLPNHLSLKTIESEATFDVHCIDNIRRELTYPELSWSDVAWLKREINVPLVLKGILTAEDAALAVDAGVDGIIVSNHGGRQLDSVPATIDVLPEVVEAVAGRCEVYVDGGVRSGIDVVKALALGARAVFIGRPVLWGLGYDGEKGVDSVLSIFHEELKTAMALTGARTVDSIVPSMVRHVSSFGKLTHKL